MLNYMIHHIFWNWSVWKFLLLVGVTLLAFGIFWSAIHILHRKKRLTFYNCICLEEVLTVLVTAFWMAALFYPYLSLPLWIGFYFLYGKWEARRRMIKYYLTFPHKKYHRIRFERMVETQLDSKDLIPSFYRKIKEIYDDSDKTVMENPKWRTTALPLRTYLSGLIPFSIVLLVSDFPLCASGYLVLSLLENILCYTGIAYGVYLFQYYIEVVNWRGRWTDFPKIFHVAAILIYLVGLVLVVLMNVLAYLDQ